MMLSTIRKVRCKTIERRTGLQCEDGRESYSPRFMTSQSQLDTVIRHLLQRPVSDSAGRALIAQLVYCRE